MKKGLIIILFLTLSSAVFSQQDKVVSNDTNVIEAPKTEQVDAKSTVLSADLKAKVLKLNRKKSNEIISIKAYRKSLQIKVKTVKLC